MSILAGEIEFWRECPNVLTPCYTYVTLIMMKINVVKHILSLRIFLLIWSTIFTHVFINIFGYTSPIFKKLVTKLKPFKFASDLCKSYLSNFMRSNVILLWRASCFFFFFFQNNFEPTHLLGFTAILLKLERGMLTPLCLNVLKQGRIHGQ